MSSALSSDQLFRDLLESAPDAMVIVDSSGQISLINAQTERMFGYSREELIGQPVEKLVPERFFDVHLQHRSKYSADPTPRAMGIGLDLFAVRSDGSEFPVEISLSPLDTPSGLLVSAAVRDVTESRRARAETEAARSEAERANQAKSEFLSRMSHELRTPLNAILGFGQLLEMERLTVKQEESLRQIMRAGRHLLELIDEVLDISRIETGRLTVSPEPIAVDAALSEAIQLVLPLAAERGIAFEERQGCVGQFVLADRQRLRQVLLNLLSNAVKYNRPEGSVVVDCHTDSEQGIRISVEDDGPGIPEEMLERIFLPFDRLGADTSEVQGTGLGLALSKGLVQTMGGVMSVESTIGEGSRFWFTLPLAESPERGLEEMLASTKATSSQATASVLYIEDNISNLKLVERVLELRPSIRLVSAMQGSIGLDMAHQHLPDLILLDLHLPDINGEEVLKLLRADSVTRDIPVAIITADATPGRVQRLLASGASAYLTKPIDVNELLALFDETLSS